MKKLLLTVAALVAITATTAHAATWWTSTKDDAGWHCVHDDSPASKLQWLRNQGFSPLVSNYGDTVIVEEGPGGSGYFYFRNVQACWRGINLADPG